MSVQSTMKRFLALIVLMILAAAVLVSQTPLLPPPPPPTPVRVNGEIAQNGEGLIEGLVRRLNGDGLISGVQVTLVGGPPDATNAVGQLSTTTGNDGRFIFRNLPPGRYTVAFRRDGYLPRRPVPGAPDPTQLTVRPGRSATAVSIAMVQGGTISGRILDPMGRPAASTAVSAVRRFYQDGRPSLGPVKSTTSDDRGEYRLFWLEPGEYLVMAEKNLPSGPARGYFPGSDDGRAALPVLVSEGSESGRTDFSLGATPATVTVSGFVSFEVPGFEASSAPQFFLWPKDAGRLYEGMAMFSNSLANTQERALGKFELRNVRSGSYELYAVVRDGSSKYYVAHAPVDVGTQGLSGVVLTIRPGVDLTGTITAGLGKPVPPSRVQLRPRVALPNWPGVMVASTDGTFTFPNVPESEYTITIEPLEPNFYVAELLQGQDSILDRGVVKVARGLPDRLEVLIQPSASTIRGTVLASPSQLAAGVMVTLVPEASRRENLALYQRFLSTEGAFAFTGVAPGKYRILAWEGIPDGAEQNAAFMEAHKDDGTDVVVSPQSTSSVEVRLIPK